jgi:peptidoglycan/LPS O-acetylase OafA/YrhL
MPQGWTGRLACNWNTPAWSLSREMFFCPCFPLVIVRLGGADRGGARLCATVGAAQGRCAGHVEAPHPPGRFSHGRCGGTLALSDALRPLNALLLIGLALGGEWLAHVLAARVAVHLGQASYTMHILHIPLLWWHSRLRTCWLGPP